MYLYHQHDSDLTKAYARLRAMQQEPQFLLVSVSEDGYLYSSTHEACDRTQKVSALQELRYKARRPGRI